MRALFSILVILLASLSLQAQLTIDQLRARMQQSSGGNKAKFAMQIAAMRVEQASTEFNAGQSDKGHDLIREATELVRVAGDASLEANKKVKDTEISVRKLERRLQEIHRSVSFDDQDEIDESLKMISVVRNQLLDRMFSLDKEDKKKK
jgi:hypothetical protein